MRAMETPAPSSYAITGPEVDRHDFHNVHQMASDNDAQFSVDSVDETGVKGRWFEPDSRGGFDIRNAMMTWAEFSRSPVLISYKRGSLDAVFSHPIEYLLGGRLRVRTHWAWKRFTRSVSHLQGLAREDRMRVLRIVVDRKINHDKPTTFVDALSAIHGLRWLYHPQKESQQRHVKLTLDSLQETGDLQKQGTAYEPSPKALSTLHIYETEQKRFGTQNFHSLTIAFLTLALVIVGVVQATAPIWTKWVTMQL